MNMHNHAPLQQQQQGWLHLQTDQRSTACLACESSRCRSAVSGFLQALQLLLLLLQKANQRH
jgi:hypothetical protein